MLFLFAMQTKRRNDCIFIRLFPDEDLIEQVKNACREHQVITAVVLSAVGQLKQVTLGYFKGKDDYTPEEFDGPFELLSLTGIISFQNGEYFPHFHVILGDHHKETKGGHLIKGTVEVTNEIVLLETNVKINRELEPSTGLFGLFLSEET